MADVERWAQHPALAQYARTSLENDNDIDVLADLSEQDLESSTPSPSCSRSTLPRSG
jgi:hypothetical protein